MSIRLYLPETRFAVASIPLEQYGEVVSCLSGIRGFVSMMRDKEEITLIVTEDEWEKVATRFPGARTQGQRRMIRFDTVLDIFGCRLHLRDQRRPRRCRYQHPEPFDLQHRRRLRPRIEIRRGRLRSQTGTGHLKVHTSRATLIRQRRKGR
jgi:hypothetical protein